MGTLGLLYQRRRFQQASVDHELIQPLFPTVPYRHGCSGEWAVSNRTSDNRDSNTSFLQPTPDFRTEFPDGQERITHVQASHRSGYGLIRSEWQYKTDGRISYTATVPANSTATLYLPVCHPTDRITESGKRLKKAKGVTFRGMKDGKAVIELQSGTYKFDTEAGKNRFRRYDEDG